MFIVCHAIHGASTPRAKLQPTKTTKGYWKHQVVETRPSGGALWEAPPVEDGRGVDDGSHLNGAETSLEFELLVWKFSAFVSPRKHIHLLLLRTYSVQRKKAELTRRSNDKKTPVYVDSSYAQQVTIDRFHRRQGNHDAMRTQQVQRYHLVGCSSPYGYRCLLNAFRHTILLEFKYSGAALRTRMHSIGEGRASSYYWTI